jgi:ATP-dependent helicase/nuclease subunit B
MYDWLPGALEGSSQVVTANRRLARSLISEFGRMQIAAGSEVWRSPSIFSWQAWIGERLDSVSALEDLPTRINSHHSQVLWERCLAREIHDPLLNLGALVSQAQDTWKRMHEWNVSIDACASSATGADQRIFGRAAENYQSILQRERWSDDYTVAGLLISLIKDDRIALPDSVVLAGFDRIVPQVQMMMDALRELGCSVAIAPEPTVSATSATHSYENVAAEMRAAGAWARRELETSPEQRIAIISSDLEQDSAYRTRLVREGLIPAWQYSGPRYAAALNVSYGQSLADYPAIATALRILRWMHEPLGAHDISLLLRTSLIGGKDGSGRARLELALRQLPDRNWSPGMLLGALQGCDETPDSLDWLRRIEGVADRSEAMPRRDAPSAWAVLIDEVLEALHWPGEQVLGSVEFQLVNRWRDLLNELARLELVLSSITFAEALSRLSSMAGATVFQAETDDSVVQLMGPLEAAGMQFDRLWVCGLSTANWPPQGRPLALVSRDLQRELGMPDAVPQDTVDYAERVLRRICRSAPDVVFSYARTDGDIEQTVTALLPEDETDSGPAPIDPEWHAAALCHLAVVSTCNDSVPSVAAGEKVLGGATTIQLQVSDPFSAFAVGRLGVRRLQSISGGLSASLRGSLIHDALQRLYEECPSQAQIASWNADERQTRINRSIRAAFIRHERNVDPVLQQILLLEQSRVAALLEQLVGVDLGREPFTIAAVEQSLVVTMSGVTLGFRIDRLDRLSDGSLVILDYKTGTKKRLLDRDREPTQLQLIVYACAIDEEVSGMGLFNIDSRSIDIDGAGRTFSSTDTWVDDLSRWKLRAENAAAGIQSGDVRVNMSQGGDATRPLGLLSRVEELRHDL